MASVKSGPSLESWTRRVRSQLFEVLEPQEQFSDIAPTEAIYISLQAETGLTLIALAHLARDDEVADVSGINLPLSMQAYAKASKWNPRQSSAPLQR